VGDLTGPHADLFGEFALQARFRFLARFHGARRNLQQRATGRPTKLTHEKYIALNQRDDRHCPPVLYDLSRLPVAARQFDVIDAEAHDVALVHAATAHKPLRVHGR